MFSDNKLDSLHRKYNGPIPATDYLRAQFDGADTHYARRYDCAEAGSMVQHYSAMSSALVQTITKLGQDALARMQRKFHKQELSRLLAERRKWKSYRLTLGNCPEI